MHSRIGKGDTNEAYVVMQNAEKIAAVRTHIDHHTRLFTCASGSTKWQDKGPLTLPMQHPGHLLTGYYTNASESYAGYQFGVLTWKLSDLLSPQELLSISDGKKMTR